jgi:hypothetical protein
VWIDRDRLKLEETPPALEAFDWLLVTQESFDSFPLGAKEALESYAAFGGQVILVSGQNQAVRHLGMGGIRSIATMAQLATIEPLTWHHRGSLLERNVVQTFAPPDWQEMDLRKLLTFAAIYHAIFLAALLLPLLLDSKKSMSVYLVSVAFVTVLVVALSTQVLRKIFLKDNQVYSQSITLLVGEDNKSGRLIARQFLCYASMSGEVRDFVLPGARDAVVYGLSSGDEPVVRRLEGEDLKLLSVKLDRSALKRVVRMDHDVPNLFGITPGEDSFAVRLDSDASDPLGIRSAQILDAVLVEGGAQIARFTFSNGVLQNPKPAADSPWPTGLEFMVRRLLGHFSPRVNRFLLIQIKGLPRPDDTKGYFGTRDLGAFAVLPL